MDKIWQCTVEVRRKDGTVARTVHEAATEREIRALVSQNLRWYAGKENLYGVSVSRIIQKENGDD